jgi:hypothetical protein
MMRTIMIVAVAGTAAACGGDGRTGMDGGTGAISGTVVGPMAAAGPVVVVWAVDAVQHDYAYKFGDGTATAAMFTVPGLRDPPTTARTQAASVDVGVGVLVLLRPGASLPEGMLTSQLDAVGYSLQYAVIYRGTADTGKDIAWTSRFPVGRSCGRCVAASSGFDTFEPVDCTTLVIDTDPNAPACNWQ